MYLVRVVQGAEIRGCKTLMVYKKRQKSRQYLALSALEIGVHVHTWHPQFRCPCIAQYGLNLLLYQANFIHLLSLSHLA